MSTKASSAGIEDYIDVLDNDLKVIPKDCYGVIPRKEVPANEDVPVLIKSAKFTKMEKCLLVIMSIQSVILVVAIICVTVQKRGKRTEVLFKI